MPTIDCRKKPLIFSKDKPVPNRINEEFKKQLNAKEGIKKPKKSKKKKDELDLNGDGKVDSKDASIASKVMNAVKSKIKKKKSKKVKK